MKTTHKIFAGTGLRNWLRSERVRYRLAGENQITVTCSSDDLFRIACKYQLFLKKGL